MNNSQNNIKYIVNGVISSLIIDCLKASNQNLHVLYNLLNSEYGLNSDLNLNSQLKNAKETLLIESLIYKNETKLNTTNIANIDNKLTASVFIVWYYKYLVSWLSSSNANFSSNLDMLFSLVSYNNKPINQNFNVSGEEYYLNIYKNLNLGSLLKTSLEALNPEIYNIHPDLILNEDHNKITQDIIVLSLDILNEIYINSLTNILLHSNSIEIVRVTLLGKNSLIVHESKSLGKLPPEEKKIKGLFINLLKTGLNTIIESAKNLLSDYELQQKLLQESLDISMPVYSFNNGGVHPISYVLEEVVNIFNDLGFNIVEGPEIDDEWHNFTALNFDEFHPAKDNHDTFYFKDNSKKLLRTHTSTVQIRALQSCTPPLKIIVPGKVYRSDDDATHTPMFHQIEGLYINNKVSIAELKNTLITFCRKFFNIPDLPLRFRPSYFPFTSPSLEVDINCRITKDGVIIGRGDGWLEILGCGMVHPNILKTCNISPKEYKGFAFGLGIERLAMLKYGFPDLRDFFTSNYMWLQTYNFNILSTLCKNIK